MYQQSGNNLMDRAVKIADERNNNLQLLRLVFASFVWIGHSFSISYQKEPWLFNSYNLASLGVFGFFTISGFLITGSYLNLNSLPQFLLRRSLRIFPALILSLILGALLALISVPSGMLNSDFYSSVVNYFVGNATLMDISSNSINGAFIGNGTQIVNGPLWTLPLEFRMYLFVAFLGVLGLLQFRQGLVIIFLLCVADFAALKSTVLLNIVEPTPNQSVFPVICFFSGMVFRLTNIRLNFYLLIPCVVILFYYDQYRGIHLVFQVVCTAYVVLFFGYRINLFRGFFNRVGDYSYGVYVYAFPIQQFVWYVANHYFDYQLSPWLLIGLSGLVLFPVAILSWHFVEAYFLNLKDRVLIQKRAALI
jgi:peptidoglycan/LPS O-acetylase OafA/YrhL